MQQKVLVIDDDNRNIFAITAVLKAKGFDYITATNVIEAFAIMEKNNEQVGIILMDIMMPGMDGYEAIKHFKSIDAYKHIPIVAVTAKAMAGDKEKCIAAGADDYISKPVDVDVLMQLLKQYLK